MAGKVLNPFDGRNKVSLEGLRRAIATMAADGGERRGEGGGGEGEGRHDEEGKAFVSPQILPRRGGRRWQQTANRRQVLNACNVITRALGDYYGVGGVCGGDNDSGAILRKG